MSHGDDLVREQQSNYPDEPFKPSVTDLAVVVRTVDYRGDHAENMSLVVRVPLTSTVANLLALAKRHSAYCIAVVEIKAEADLPRSGVPFP